MRVISGSKRGTNLKAPSGERTRPTTDRTKETLFNVLMPYVEESLFLDLFSGSGGIAIEALSRGAKKAVLVERDKKALEAIRWNLNKTGFGGDMAVVFPQDARGALDFLSTKGMGFDLVFMDPPYNMGLEKDVLIKLKKLSLLNEGAIVVVEASRDTDFSYISQFSYEIWKRKEYKTNQHLFLTLSKKGPKDR